MSHRIGGLVPLPPLDMETERELIRRMTRGKEASLLLHSTREISPDERKMLLQQVREGDAATEELLRSSLGLARWRARPFGGGEEFEAAGVDGIREALVRFDPAKDVRFATYASYWVTKMIHQAVREWLGISDDMMRLVTTFRKSLPGDDSLHTPGAVADRLGVSLTVAATILECDARLRRGDVPLDGDEGTSPAETAKIPAAPAWVMSALKTACGQDFDVFWQATFHTTSQEELAELHGISRQAIAKRIARARKSVQESPDAPRLLAWLATQ